MRILRVLSVASIADKCSMLTGSCPGVNGLINSKQLCSMSTCVQYVRGDKKGTQACHYPVTADAKSTTPSLLKYELLQEKYVPFEDAFPVNGETPNHLSSSAIVSLIQHLGPCTAEGKQNIPVWKKNWR